jgi:ABC-type amino acid transport substrate-binding protein
VHLWISSALHRAAVVVLLLALAPLGARANDLEEVVKGGRISVALYKEFAPFSDEGKGVDVDIAKALAGKLGVKLVELWFDADENMDDDLRNMVWRGTVLGYGPADFMIHVPVDKEYMSKNDKVIFFAPYYRERFAIARNVEKIASLDSLAPFRTEKIGVESATYPDTVLLSIESGAYRNNVVHFKNTEEAIEALKKGEVAAVMAMQGELEGGLFKSKGFEISEPPIPVIGRRQWPLGLAVKAGNEELARALQKGINDLVADGTIQKIFDHHGVKYRAP